MQKNRFSVNQELLIEKMKAFAATEMLLTSMKN